MKQIYITCMAFIILVITGCVSSRPVLYPNAQFQQGGQIAADQAIDSCKALAREAGISSANYKGRETAQNTAQGAAIGAVSGLVGGALSGRLGVGTAVGAASGATAGLISGLFSVNEPNPTYQNFINRCLQERGYDVLGWE